MILSTPPAPHHVHQETAAGDTCQKHQDDLPENQQDAGHDHQNKLVATTDTHDAKGDTWRKHHDDLPENQQDAGYDQNKLVATTDTHDAKGASDGLWAELLAHLPEVHIKVDYYSFKDDVDYSDEFNSTMEQDLDGGSHGMSKDKKDIDNNNECIGLTQKELDGGPSKKPKLMMDSTGNKDECAGQKLKEVDGGPSEKPKPTMDRTGKKVGPEQYCPICDRNSGHWYTDCPDRLKGMGLLCLECDRQACMKCMKEHPNSVLEALKYCRYCSCLGNHWIEECPMVEIHRRDAQIRAEYDSSEADDF